MPELFDLREDFNQSELNDNYIPSDPFQLFEIWIKRAIEINIPDANAMVLSTCDGFKPSSRVVLLKYYDEKGFVFFTNYNSKKGKDLTQNKNASLLFFWSILEQQIRIEGIIEKTSEEISNNYFYKRPFKSQVSAVISPQSQSIVNREWLENKYNKKLDEKADIKRPEYWGGYYLRPVTFEFWQGRMDRLHDRIFYEQENAVWKHVRLAP